MTIGYTLSGGMAPEAPGLDLYERYPVMREWIDQVSDWTGVDVDRLLVEDFSESFYAENPRFGSDVRFVAELRQAAYSIGISDVLADMGVRPDAIAGSSLGLMVGACLAGAIERTELVELLRHRTSLPLAPEGEPARGVAVAVLPGPDELDRYVGDHRPNVYLAAELGEFIDGGQTMYMFSGYLDDLRALAAEEPPGQVNVISFLGGAHSPLEQFVYDLRKPFIDKMTIRDPEVALYSALDGRRLVTAEDVYTDFLRNTVQTTYTSNIGKGLAAHGVELGFAIGVTATVTMFKFPFPILPVLTAEDFEQVGPAIHNHGIELKFA
ncbi:hypothetical protein [Micromonospora eburnea]|uniref:Malonyl CoA-acyl carrier protein transacylase n=1 Tax=Micromonospora eburnea TaxID=227316 RepID=A0A1C6UIR0_9ACTN|nr:hypothetical protein [Micromonospora eburnea]SCL53975.1 Malonyl CoA-acyl carrier protein transacylase [Micromonospora eburnea]